jgi:hypothetical protein
LIKKSRGGDGKEKISGARIQFIVIFAYDGHGIIIITTRERNGFIRRA